MSPDVPQTFTNPFTGVGTVTTSPPSTSVTVSVHGAVLGAIEFDDDAVSGGELLIYAPDDPTEALRAIVTAVALKLGADVFWIPKMEP